MHIDHLHAALLAYIAARHSHGSLAIIEDARDYEILTAFILSPQVAEAIKKIRCEPEK